MNGSIPKVSVLMSVYNGEKYLSLAIESILNQSFSNFEFIIIDDGSTDGSEAIIQSYRDPRICFVNQPNAGLSASLNKGIGLCKGEFIARMDADDIARPARFETQVNFLETHPDCALVGSAVQVIDGEGKNKWIMAHTRGDLETRWFILFDTPFIHSSVMLRRALLEQTGPYSQNPEFSFAEDYELWSRLAEKFEVANLSEPLLVYRDNPLGVSHSKREAQDQQSLAISAANLSRFIGIPVSLEEARLFRPDHFFNPELKKLTLQNLADIYEKILKVYRIFCDTYSAELTAEPRVRDIIKTETAYILLNIARLFAFKKAYKASIAAIQNAFSLNSNLIFGVRFWKMIAKFILGK